MNATDSLAAAGTKRDTWFDTLILGLSLCLITASAGTLAGLYFPQMIQTCGLKIMALPGSIASFYSMLMLRGDPVLALAMVALVYLCNYWVTHPVLKTNDQ